MERQDERWCSSAAARHCARAIAVEIPYRSAPGLRLASTEEFRASDPASNLRACGCAKQIRISEKRGNLSDLITPSPLPSPWQAAQASWSRKGCRPSSSEL